MAFVTLEIGPTWRMQLLRGLLEARGLQAVVLDDSLSVYMGQAPSTSQLQVSEEALETARTIVAEAQHDGSAALEKLRFGVHERFRAPRPLKSMLLDAAFWLALFLAAIWVLSLLFS
jgi:hypothetical protein